MRTRTPFSIAQDSLSQTESLFSLSLSPPPLRTHAMKCSGCTSVCITRNHSKPGSVLETEGMTGPLATRESLSGAAPGSDVTSLLYFNSRLLLYSTTAPPYVILIF